MESSVVRKVARLAIVLSSIGALGACGASHQRAWANGQAMTRTQAYQAIMAGDRRVETFRELYVRSNPLVTRHRELAPYTPFTSWRY